MTNINKRLLSITYLIFALSTLGVCAGDIDDKWLDRFHANGKTSLPVTSKDSGLIKLQYLGVSGYLIEYSGYKLLLGPSFSNPSVAALMASLASGNLEHNPELIDKYYPAWGQDNQSLSKGNVEAILIGHAHYDHLLDVPYIMKKYTRSAKAYGSLTMRTLLRSKGIEQNRAVALNDRVSSIAEHSKENWTTVSNGRIRFLALESDHSPLIGSTMFAPGQYDGEPVDEQLTGLEWKLGKPLAFLIDFLDEQSKIVYRIHYVDTSSDTSKGYGKVPKSVLAQKRVDLAIVCMAAFDHGGDYPVSIIKHLNPKTIIAGHWEHFFDNQGEKQKVVSGIDYLEFIQRIQTKGVLPPDSRWMIPNPYLMMTLPP